MNQNWQEFQPNPSLKVLGWPGDQDGASKEGFKCEVFYVHQI
jgi:hypothetical protein